MHPNDQLVLSLFPGVDLFGRAFELAGFRVVRGPELFLGQDVRGFHVPPYRFDGVISGPPCQDFSRARRTPRTGRGVEMLHEFLRLIDESRPAWWLLENVPSCPDVRIGDYSVQRIDVTAAEAGLPQWRMRHFQFGCQDGRELIVHRRESAGGRERAVMATDGKRGRKRSFARTCRLMGLTEPIKLQCFTREGAFRAVGNGVPLPMGLMMARAIANWLQRPRATYACACGCGRPVTTHGVTATVTCRKRKERRRRGKALTLGTVVYRLQPAATPVPPAGVTGPTPELQGALFS